MPPLLRSIFVLVVFCHICGCAITQPTLVGAYSDQALPTSTAPVPCPRTWSCLQGALSVGGSPATELRVDPSSLANEPIANSNSYTQRIPLVPVNGSIELQKGYRGSMDSFPGGGLLQAGFDLARMDRIPGWWITAGMWAGEATVFTYYASFGEHRVHSTSRYFGDDYRYDTLTKRDSLFTIPFEEEARSTTHFLRLGMSLARRTQGPWIDASFSLQGFLADAGRVRRDFLVPWAILGFGWTETTRFGTLTPWVRLIGGNITPSFGIQWSTAIGFDHPAASAKDAVDSLRR